MSFPIAHRAHTDKTHKKAVLLTHTYTYNDNVETAPPSPSRLGAARSWCCCGATWTSTLGRSRVRAIDLYTLIQRFPVCVLAFLPTTLKPTHPIHTTTNPYTPPSPMLKTRRPKSSIHRRPHHHALHPPGALRVRSRPDLRALARAPGCIPRLRRHASLWRPLSAHPPPPRFNVQPALPVWVLRLCLLLGGAEVNDNFEGRFGCVCACVLLSGLG